MSLRFDPAVFESARALESPADAAEGRAMRLALREARRGIGGTHPNPRVGAVILRAGRIVASGYHARAGGPHAEVRALAAAGTDARGATLVATLEPCAHFGKTPPCTQSILDAGIRRVVIGMRDPCPLVDGKGIERLREAGVDVSVGLLESECREINPPYLKQLGTGLPWVTLKAMLSLDGRIASESGESRGLGSEDEIRLAHRLRAEHDAVIVGVGTVERDDPLLTVRHGRKRSPARVVLDSTLRTPAGARIWEVAGAGPLIFAATSAAAPRAESFRSRGAEVWLFQPGAEGRVPLLPLLGRLAGEGLLAVLVEGGAQVHTSFLREGLADSVQIGIAPLLLGGKRAPLFTGDLGRSRIAEGIPVEQLRVRRVGRDVWLEGRIGGEPADHV